MPKPKPEAKPKPKPADNLFVRLKRELNRHAKQVQDVQVAISKIGGILNGAHSADTTDNLRHRVRSILGHRKAIASAVGVLGEMFKSLHAANYELS